MHTIELSDEELKLLHAALHSYLDDFGHEEADILRDVKAVIAKLPRPSVILRLRPLEPRRLEDDDPRAAPVSAGRVCGCLRRRAGLCASRRGSRTR